MDKLAAEYFYLVAIAAIGAIQAAAAYNGLNGISFFRQKVFNYLFALLTVGATLARLFTWNQRNPVGIIEGAQQFSFFMLALVVAIAFTLAVSSLLRHSALQGNHPQHNGLEALREITFFQALWRRYIHKQ
ncbi:MAG: hypothetical protein KAI14_02725 [Dehalococcoidales bacterium]|nr:hypothetical protein [Dehalococcoidales bacterium]